MGAEEPEYIVHGEDIMVKFKALQSARVTEKVTVRVTDALTENEQKVLEILRKNPSATYIEMANQMNISRKAVSQKIKQLKDKGHILRVGSAKKGYWKLL